MLPCPILPEAELPFGILAIAILVAVISVLVLIGVVLILRKRRTDRRTRSDRADRDPLLTGSMWDRLERGGDPALTEVFDSLIDCRDSAGISRLRDRIMRDYENSDLGPQEYEGLIGVLDRVEE